MSRTRARYRYGGLKFVGQTRLSPVGWTDKFGPTDYLYEECTDSTHRGPPYRKGGSLLIERVTKTYRYSAHNYARQTNLLNPGMNCVCYIDAYTPSTVPTRRDPSSFGAIGWNRTVPTSPILSVGNFIAELRDVPGMLRQTRDLARSLGKAIHTDPGGQYLNYQFGWKPFVQDLLGILNFQELMDKRIRQLRRDNGKPVRRACKLGSEETYQNIYSSAPGASILSPAPASNVRVTAPCSDSVTLRYRIDRWYAARYRYWIPELADPRSDLRLLKAKLAGAIPTPDVVYNSVPWTWLIDWFTNAGSVIENAVNTAEFHVVADYAYVMAHESYSYMRRASGVYGTGTFSGNPTKIVTLWASTQTKYEWKTRVPAHPYGFGVTDASLSGYQWSILSALGLSRLR